MEELDKEIATLKSEEKKADRRKKKIALKEKRKTAQRIDLKMIIPGTVKVFDLLSNIQCSKDAFNKTVFKTKMKPSMKVFVFLNTSYILFHKSERRFSVIFLQQKLVDFQIHASNRMPALSGKK